MERKHTAGLLAAIAFLLEFGGGGIMIANPDFRLIGIIFMVVGPLPLLWWFRHAIPAYIRSTTRGMARADKRLSKLKSWASLGTLDIEQVAFLWCNKPPAGSVLTAENDVRLQFETLKRAIMAGKLKPDWDERRWGGYRLRSGVSGAVSEDAYYLNWTTPILISELRRYAEATGERPAFLFD